MGDVQPGVRPVFDFVGSLDVAAGMWALGVSLTGDGKSRHDEWDVALEVWKGNVGDLVRSYIEDDKADTENVRTVLEAEAKQWAELWAETVDETNRVLAAEAREELKSHRDAADEGFQWHDLDDPFDKGEKKDDQAFDIPTATAIGTPQNPGFLRPRKPFANYVRQGDEVVIDGYLDAVPPY